MRKRKRIASVLICFAMLLGVLSVPTLAADTITNGDVVLFGSYPQTMVSDAATIDSLNRLENTSYGSLGYFSGTGEEGSATSTKALIMSTEVTLDGERYRGILIEKYRPMFTEDSPEPENSLLSDKYQQNLTYWFKYSPLKWRVLDAKKGLMLCLNSIDAQPANNTASTSSWENSSLREWLNTTFADTAFAKKEKSSLKAISLAGTSDSVSIPSAATVSDLEIQFVGNSYTDIAARATSGTDYAAIQGLDNSGAATNCAPWWTVDDSLSQEDAELAFEVVMPDSTIDADTPFTTTCVGVRPLIQVALSAVTPAADEGTPYSSPRQTVALSTLKAPIVQLGSYPQSLVEDEKLVAQLNAELVPEYWHRAPHMTSTLSGNNDGAIFYQDVSLSGKRYQAVRFVGYRPEAVTENDTVPSTAVQEGAQQLRSGYMPDITYWFKYEPISWYVLDETNGTLLSVFILSSEALHGNIYSACDSWQASTLSKLINATSLDNGDNIRSAFADSDAARLRTDGDAAISLLSADTLTTNALFAGSDQKTAYATDFARCIGVDVSSGTYSPSPYWLTDISDGTGSVVESDGNLGTRSLATSSCGVRPLIHADISGLKIEYPQGTEPSTGYQLGDVDMNGTITAGDARLALRKSARLEALSPLQCRIADYDQNGTITAADARLILRVSARLDAKKNIKVS